MPKVSYETIERKYQELKSDDPELSLADALKILTPLGAIAVQRWLVARSANLPIEDSRGKGAMSEPTVDKMIERLR